jgi:hypothetical protein
LESTESQPLQMTSNDMVQVTTKRGLVALTQRHKHRYTLSYVLYETRCLKYSFIEAVSIACAGVSGL